MLVSITLRSAVLLLGYSRTCLHRPAEELLFVLSEDVKGSVSLNTQRTALYCSITIGKSAGCLRFDTCLFGSAIAKRSSEVREATQLAWPQLRAGVYDLPNAHHSKGSASIRRCSTVFSTG